MKKQILCACGCGQYRNKYDKRGRERKYIWGHRNRFKKGRHYSPKTEFKRGHKLPQKIEIKRRKSIGIAKQGMKFTKEHCDNISKGKEGILNPKVGIFLKGKTGEKSRNWKGGLSFEPYGFEFNEKLKEKIRKRDGYICQYCHRNQDEIGEKLSIHHIDYNKKNNDLLNLISLCRKCHTKTGANRELWKRYFIMYQFIRLILLYHQKTIVQYRMEGMVKSND